MNNKISVFSLWRDSEETAHKTLKQLENLESIEGFEFSYFFYENDSKDNTVKILEEWLLNRSGEIQSEILNAPKFGSVVDPERMKFLCECRNKCKQLAGDNNFDYSLLIDSDIEFDNNNFLIQIEDLNKLENAVMVTANTRQNISDLVFNQTEDSYYDVYAFRDSHGTNGIYFSDCPSYKRADQFNWKLGIPIITMSSFAGFAVIKSKIFNKVNWHSDIHCDHVNMCFDISKYGSIYCSPKSKTYANIDLNEINMEACVNIGKQQKETYNKYF